MRPASASTLVITGDEDRPCREPALLMKRTTATAGKNNRPVVSTDSGKGETWG